MQVREQKWRFNVTFVKNVFHPLGFAQNFGMSVYRQRKRPTENRFFPKITGFGQSAAGVRFPFELKFGQGCKNWPKY